MDLNPLKQPGPNAFALRKARKSSSSESDHAPTDQHAATELESKHTYQLPATTYSGPTPQKPSRHPHKTPISAQKSHVTPTHEADGFVWNFSASQPSAPGSGRRHGRHASHSRNLSQHKIDQRLLEAAAKGGDDRFQVRKKAPPPALNLDRASDAGKKLYGNMQAFRPGQEPAARATGSSTFSGLRPNFRKLLPSRPSVQDKQHAEPVKQHLAVAPKAAQLLGAGGHSQKPSLQPSNDVETLLALDHANEPGRLPQKAAKVLGTSSAPTTQRKPAQVNREKSLPKLGDFPLPTPESTTPQTPSPLIRVRRPDGNEDVDKPKSLHELNARLAGESRKDHYQHLRYMNDETPPTPPSKSESLLRRAGQIQRDVASADTPGLDRYEHVSTPEPSNYHEVTTGSPEVINPSKSQLPVSANGLLSGSSSQHVASQMVHSNSQIAKSPAHEVPKLIVQSVSDFHGYPSIIGGNPYSPSCYAFPEDVRKVPAEEHLTHYQQIGQTTSTQPEAEIARFEHSQDNEPQIAAGHSPHPSVSGTEIIEMYRYTANESQQLYPSPLHLHGPGFPRVKLNPVPEEQRGTSGSNGGHESLDVESGQPSSPTLRRKSGFDSRTGSPVHQHRQVARESPFSLPKISKMLQPTPESSTFAPHAQASIGDPQKAQVQDKTLTEVLARLDSIENRMSDKDTVETRLRYLEEQNEHAYSLIRSLHEKQANQLKTEANLSRKHNDFATHVVLNLNQLSTKMEALREEHIKSQHEVYNLHEKTAQTSNGIDALRNKFPSLSNELTLLRDAASASPTEYGSLCDKVSALNDEVSSLHQAISLLRAENDENTRRVDNTHMELEQATLVSPSKSQTSSPHKSQASSPFKSQPSSPEKSGAPSSSNRDIDSFTRFKRSLGGDSNKESPQVPKNAANSPNKEQPSNGTSAPVFTPAPSNGRAATPVRAAHPLDLSPQTRLTPGSARPATYEPTAPSRPGATGHKKHVGAMGGRAGERVDIDPVRVHGVRGTAAHYDTISRHAVSTDPFELETSRPWQDPTVHASQDRQVGQRGQGGAAGSPQRRDPSIVRTPSSSPARDAGPIPRDASNVTIGKALTTEQTSFPPRSQVDIHRKPLNNSAPARQPQRPSPELHLSDREHYGRLPGLPISLPMPMDPADYYTPEDFKASTSSSVRTTSDDTHPSRRPNRGYPLSPLPQLEHNDTTYSPHPAVLSPHPGTQVLTTPRPSPDAVTPRKIGVAGPGDASTTNMKAQLDFKTQMAIAPFEYGTVGGPKKDPKAWKGPGYGSQ